MTGWKNKGLHKTEPIHIQSSSHDLAAVSFAEIAKVFGADNLFLESTRLDNSASQQSTINPLGHLFWADVQCCRRGVFREPILAHASARPEPMQHGAHAPVLRQKISQGWLDIGRVQRFVLDLGAPVNNRYHGRLKTGFPSKPEHVLGQSIEGDEFPLPQAVFAKSLSPRIKKEDRGGGRS
ncbi:MAG: hypothetical protein WCA27_17515 [Candidatus Sulfotelmatobacter sp.]